MPVSNAEIGLLRAFLGDEIDAILRGDQEG